MVGAASLQGIVLGLQMAFPADGTLPFNPDEAMDWMRRADGAFAYAKAGTDSQPKTSGAGTRGSFISLHAENSVSSSGGTAQVCAVEVDAICLEEPDNLDQEDRDEVRLSEMLRLTGGEQT